MSELFRDNKKACKNCRYFCYSARDKFGNYTESCSVSVWKEGVFCPVWPIPPAKYCNFWEGRDDGEDMPD